MRTSEDDLQDLSARHERTRRRHRAREPKRAADVMAAVLNRRGYGRVIENEQLVEAWRAVIDPRLRPFTRVVRVHRRRLEVLVANSAVMQELTFVKQGILEAFNSKATTQPIADIRFRIGDVSE